jgi:hypothetical protein
MHYYLNLFVAKDISSLIVGLLTGFHSLAACQRSSLPNARAPDSSVSVRLRFRAELRPGSTFTEPSKAWIIQPHVKDYCRQHLGLVHSLRCSESSVPVQLSGGLFASIFAEKNIN